MNRNALVTCVGFFSSVLIINGCSPQPSETQKAAIENEIVSCLMAVNEDRRGDSIGSGIGGFIAALEGLTSRVDTISNRQWELIGGSDNPALINLEFRSGDTDFSCDYLENPEAGFELAEARRNGEVVYNQELNQKIIEEKKERLAMQAEEERVAQIKLWHEGGYSNVEYKYYDKKHLLSRDSFNEPILRVVCRPEGPTIGLEGRPFSMTGHRDVQFDFLISDQSTTEFFDLTTAGTVGVWTQSVFVNDVELDLSENHRFLDLLETATSISTAGVTFNVDDYNQVPCLRTRQADLAEQARVNEQQHQRYEQYLGMIKEMAADQKYDDLTKVTTYQFLGTTTANDDILWGDTRGPAAFTAVFVSVKHDESKPLDRNAFKITVATYRYVEADDTFGSIDVSLANGTIRENIELSCEYNFTRSLQDQRGLADEYCNLSPLITNQAIAELLINEDTEMRLSANGMSIDSRNGTDVQKQFLGDISSLAVRLALP